MLHIKIAFLPSCMDLLLLHLFTESQLVPSHGHVKWVNNKAALYEWWPVGPSLQDGPTKRFCRKSTCRVFQCQRAIWNPFGI